MDPATWRNPLFDLFGPRHIICIYLLHTFYLGLAKHFVGHTIWRMLSANVFRVVGPESVQHTVGLRHLMNDLKRWYLRNKIPHDLRVAELSMGMIGDKGHPDFGGKAAESGILVQWATDLCGRYADDVPNGHLMRSAGEALTTYSKILKETPLVVPVAVKPRLLDCVLRHIRMLNLSDIPLLPKHHYWAHMTMQIQERGNPRFYSTFLDETLNKIVATIAIHSHPALWQERIWQRIGLQASLKTEGHFAP